MEQGLFRGAGIVTHHRHRPTRRSDAQIKRGGSFFESTGGKLFASAEGFLTRPEIDALLGAPKRNTWLGRRDHALLLMAIQTGLRLSEMTALRQQDVVLGKGAH